MTSLAKASSSSPVAGSISSRRFSASAKRAGSLIVLLKASRMILTRSARHAGREYHRAAEFVRCHHDFG